MNSMIKPYISIAAVMLLSSAIQSCGSSKAKPENNTGSDSAAATVNSVNAFRVQEGHLSTSITIPGELTAFQNVDVYAKVSSFVKKLYVDVGSEVSQGQLLAVMDAPEINAQIDAASSRVASQKAIYLSSKATYDRLLETSKTPGTVSPNELEIADAKQKSDYAQYQSALATVKEIHDNRDYLEIRAPFSGIITARNVSAGAYVGPAGAGSAVPIFTLQEQRKLRLVINVPVSDAGTLNVNDAVSFTIKSLPGQVFKAKIARLAGALDDKLRSQHIEADVMNDNKILLPGMVAEVSLPLDNSRKAFIIPATALLNAAKGIFVIKADGNKTIWTPVATGARSADSVEVYGDLHINDTLISTVTEEVRDSADLNGSLQIQ